jgi:hypothetical protein
MISPLRQTPNLPSGDRLRHRLMLGDSEVSAIRLPKVYRGIICIPGPSAAICRLLRNLGGLTLVRILACRLKPHPVCEHAKERATRIPIAEPFCTLDYQSCSSSSTESHYSSGVALQSSQNPKQPARSRSIESASICRSCARLGSSLTAEPPVIRPRTPWPHLSERCN